MGTLAHIPVATYLHTTYRPDCDYINGEVIERNVGEIPHGWLQRFFVKVFLLHELDWRLVRIPEIRVQIAPTQFRVPDLTVLRPEDTGTLIVQTPPPLCIEIFSSDDRMNRIQERVADYARMGVPAIWIVDPWRRVAYLGENGGRLTREQTALTIPGTPVSVTVDEIFAELDRLGQSA